MSPCDNSACPCDALAAAAPAVGQPSGAPESHSVPEPGARAPARPSGMRLRACLERSPTIAAPCPPPGTRHTQSGARTKLRSAIPAQCSKRSAGFYPPIHQRSCKRNITIDQLMHIVFLDLTCKIEGYLGLVTPFSPIPPGANRTLGTSSQANPAAEPRTDRIAPTKLVPKAASCNGRRNENTRPGPWQCTHRRASPGNPAQKSRCGVDSTVVSRARRSPTRHPP